MFVWVCLPLVTKFLLVELDGRLVKSLILHLSDWWCNPRLVGTLLLVKHPIFQPLEQCDFPHLSAISTFL